MMSNVPATADPVLNSPARLSPRRRRIFLPAGMIVAALALVGFWPTYYGRLFSGTVQAPPIVHAHAVVMATWLALFLTQIWLAASGRVHLHIRLGRWVMGYTVFMMFVAVLTASEEFASRLGTGGAFQAQRWLFGILREVAFIVPFLAAGWLYRRQPEVHKRLMLVAATMLIVPAIGRMAFLGRPIPLGTYMLIWPMPVYVAMVYDFRTTRRLHAPYVIGIGAMLAERLVLPLNTSLAWHAIAAQINAFYQR